MSGGRLGRAAPLQAFAKRLKPGANAGEEGGGVYQETLLAIAAIEEREKTRKAEIEWARKLNAAAAMSPALKKVDQVTSDVGEDQGGT